MAARKRLFMVADKIKAIIAQELNRVSDPRLELVTITSVVPSPDLRQAKVYWMVSGSEERKTEVGEAFSSAAGHFKRVLAGDLGLRHVPDLRFYYDDTLETENEVERLFEKVRSKREGTGET